MRDSLPSSLPHDPVSGGGSFSPLLRSLIRTSVALCLLLMLCSARNANAQASGAPVAGQPGPNLPVPDQAGVQQNAPLNPKLPTIFVVGDSTARNKADLGWGDHFAHYFDTTKVNVANRAIAGRSARSYMNEGAWDKVLAEIKPGDYVLLQWGHNDGGPPLTPQFKARGEGKGIGDESVDIPITTPYTVGPLAGKTTETVHTYGWYNRKYIADARAKGATPILLTVTVRDIWTPGADGTLHIERDMGYRDYDFQIAEAEHVPLVDMAKVAADKFEMLGPDTTRLLFPIDHTHTSAVGAEMNAASVVTALKDANSQLVQYLAPPKAPSYGPAQTTAAEQAVPPPPPQTNVTQRAPLNPALPTIFVVGDSTASNGPNLGWGSHLGDYFDLTKVNVANRAIAGRSSRSYMDEGHWDSTLAEIKAGDYVLLQWGQNDGGDLGGAGSRNARGDLRGDGDATQDVAQTVGPMKDKVETIHTYGWYNRKYVADILAKHATPMFLSMTIHNTWKADANGTEHVALDMRFGPVMWKIAQENHLAFIDMAAVEAVRMDSVGKDAAAKWFPIDWVHTSPEGADLNAQSVVIALEIAKSPLLKYLKAPLPIPAGTEEATKASEAQLAAIAASNGPPAFVAPAAAAGEGASRPATPSAQ